MKTFISLAMLISALSFEAMACYTFQDPSDEAKAIIKDIRDVIDSEDGLCKERAKYLKPKIEKSLNLESLLDFAKKKEPDVLLVGENHSVDDFRELFFYEIIDKYKELYPELDCVLLEFPPTLQAGIAHFSEHGGKYVEKFGSNFEQLMDAYCKDHKFKCERITKQQHAEMLQKKHGGEKVQPVSSPNDTAFYLLNGKRFYQTTMEHALFYIQKGLSVHYIDERKLEPSRDIQMSDYIQDLHSNKRCTKSIFNGGKGHLRPMKRILNEKGISNFTINLQTNSHYQLNAKYYGKKRQIKVVPALDYGTCKYPYDYPESSFGILTEGDKEGFLVERDDTSFEFMWNEFDAHFLIPTKKDVYNYFVQ